jgi:amidase
LVKDHRDLAKDTVVWEVERGQRLSAMDIGHAEMQGALSFTTACGNSWNGTTFLLPAEPGSSIRRQAALSERGRRRCHGHIHRLDEVLLLHFTVGNPALSVPCGYTPEGLLVGIQIVGRHRDDWGLPRWATRLEQAAGVERRVPALAVS